MSDTIPSMSTDQIGAHKARLAQYADILAAFHADLIACSLPADAARECVVEWWRSELSWEPEG